MILREAENTKATLHEEMPCLRFAGRHTDGCNVSLHRHHCAELILITSGSCQVEAGGNSFKLAEQQLLVLPSDLPHNQLNCDPSEPAETVYVGFRNGSEPFDTSARVVDLRRYPAVGQVMNVLAAMRQTPHTYDHAAASNLVLALLSMIRHAEQPIHISYETHPKLTHAVEYLQDHLHQPISVPELARAVALSPSHLTSLFREHLGCPPLQFALRMRMNLACRHLAEPYLSVKEIAALCGYANLSLFLRHFKRSFGISPGKWRADPDRLNDVPPRLAPKRFASAGRR